jgi:hypothetical protein
MKTHEQIDERSLTLAREIVEKIDRDPARTGLERARVTARRWFERDPAPAIKEWLEILEQPWEEIRELLLDESEHGQRLRQSDPFCGILTPRERWMIYRAYHEES